MPEPEFKHCSLHVEASPPAAVVPGQGLVLLLGRVPNSRVGFRAGGPFSQGGFIHLQQVGERGDCIWSSASASIHYLVMLDFFFAVGYFYVFEVEFLSNSSSLQLACRLLCDMLTCSKTRTQ